jgi:hypothetical protein
MNVFSAEKLFGRPSYNRRFAKFANIYLAGKFSSRKSFILPKDRSSLSFANCRKPATVSGKPIVTKLETMNSRPYKFFIDRTGMYGSQDLQTDKFIFKTNDPNPPIGVGGDFEGPYLSVHELTQKSKFYKDLKENNPRTASKLIHPKNVNEVQNFMLIPKGKTFEMDLYILIQHALKAEFKNGGISGLHFFNPNNTKMIKVYNSNSNGVLDAEILKLDNESNKWHKKRTTLFPLHWHVGNIFAALEIAYLYRFLLPNAKNKFGGITPNGTKVIFAFMNGKPKTVYPIL